MTFLRRAPLVSTTVDLHEGSGVAVTITPAGGRWPGHEEADRLVVPLGLAAIALARAQDHAIGPVREHLRQAAAAIVDADLADELPATLLIAVSGLHHADAGGPGVTRIVVKLVRSPVGPVPTMNRQGHAAPVLVRAAAAVLAVALTPCDADIRLAAALSLEGLLGWYREADPQLQPPQQAIAYALRHAEARLAEEGRAVPAALATAVHEHRKLSPMAGGA